VLLKNCNWRIKTAASSPSAETGTHVVMGAIRSGQINNHHQTNRTVEKTA